jgi:hypothetical protein
MKVIFKTARVLLSMSIATIALLLSQQAMAQDTGAGVVISNQASIDYDVNGQDQTDILSTDINSPPGTAVPTTFVVDRRVDFSIVTVVESHTQVQPGDSGFTEFQLTNNSNATMDFALDRVNLTSADGTVWGETDTDNPLSTYEIFVDNDGSGAPDVINDYDYVDELAPGGTVTIYVFATAGATLPNGTYDNFTLNATAADTVDASANPDALDPLLTQAGGADNPTVIENVFANDNGEDGSGNATEGASDGFNVTSAQLVITKEARVVSAPFGSEKAIPGAVIEYTVTLDNSAGAEAAESVVMTDQIQTTDVGFELGGYGGTNQDIAIDGAACSAAADTDGCTYDGSTDVLTVTIPSIAAGATATITYRVRITTATP